ncbi:NAD(P)/FAD-dependent oxidoreductase [Rhizobium sp. YIM 134829]|uniref:NAD(P)/FAD-dependent oxidoreductase n=1 Tax=Rhizobium sp. YIM 134829 TaxID=3390453 RepID=UPI0039785B65
MARRIAIIGAGLAGLTVARALAGTAAVTLFEKSRGPGGRMAHRSRDGFEADHGAQYFTARSPTFRDLVAAAEAAGAVAPWTVDLVRLPDREERPSHASEPRYVGTPGMNGLAAFLAEGLDLRRETEISAIEGSARRWTLRDKTGAAHGPFDVVVAAVPAPQAARLLPKVSPLQAPLAAARMSGCFTLMVGLVAPLDLPVEAARIDHPVLSFLARNTSKPGRGPAESWVAHSRNDWAEAHLEVDRATIEARMLAALKELTGLDLSAPPWLDLHRWRYANVEHPAGLPHLLDADQGLAACGDWCRANRVEAAFESGESLAAALSDLS